MSDYVKNEVFYHFHRQNRYSSIWVPGNQIDFTHKQPNEFNAYYSDKVPNFSINGKKYYPIEAINVISSMEKEVQEGLVNEYIKFTRQIAYDYAIYLREAVFEDVRQQYFPSLPSRRTCIWVFKSESTDYWMKALAGDGQLLKLHLTGVIHRADQRHLDAEILPENLIRQRAFDYWTGTDGMKPLEEEYLFEGIVKVIETVTSRP